MDVTTGTPLLSVSTGRTLRIDSVIAGNDGMEITGGAATGGVALLGANTFTGGIFLSNGSLGDNTTRTTTAGLNNNDITVTGTSFACFAGGTTTSGGVHINAGSEFRAGTNNSNFAINGVLSGSGTLTHQQYGLGNQRIDLLNTNNTFTGNLDYDMPRNATTIVNSLGDDGRVRFGLTNFLNNQDRQHVFEFGSGATADLVFNTREFEILGSAPTTTPRPNAAFEIRSTNANHALVINTSLINSHTGTEANLRFSGSGNQANTFAGNIGDGPGDGTDPSVLNIFKLNAGTWILAGQNTYTGNTTVSAGTLTFADTSETRFRIGDHAANNAILGTGTINLDGMFVFDLTGASTTAGDFWNIVDVGSLNETYGSTFDVNSTLGAFSETSSGIWSITENGMEYEFSQFTGVLTVIPEPRAALLGGLGLLALLRRRRG